MNEGIKMQISAFVDGELPENEAELLLRRLSQDQELRQQAAEYFAIGRALRGQSGIAGMGDLRARISAAIDDKASGEGFDVSEIASGRYVRPLAGFAIAATVALVAIFGLQQTAVVPGVESELTDADTYTVPELEYFQLHNQYSLQSGSNNFNARMVSVRMREDGTLETDLEEIDPPDDTASVVEEVEEVEATEMTERQTP